MKSNCIELPASALAQPDYGMLSTPDKEQEKILPEKGDIVEFRCKGIVVETEGENVVVEVRHVNDERIEAIKSPEESAEEEESKLTKAAKEEDGYSDDSGE
jgi:hypothetical protein